MTSHSSTPCSFFDSFPDFEVNENRALSKEFKRLASQRKWKKGSKTWRKRWNQFVNMEYDRFFGGNRFAGLEDWQDLCDELDLEGPFDSINQCRKALSKVYVNIIDLLDCRQLDRTPKKFRNIHELANYTKQTQFFFSRDFAKEDKLLKVLRKRLF